MRDRHPLAGADSLPPQTVKNVQVSGVITIILQVCLCLENLLPILLHACWRRPGQRTLSDKLVASLCATYVLSAVIPSPLGLASYFHGSWYGGVATCECFQVTSTWCSLSALAIVTYLSVVQRAHACTLHAPHAQSSSTCVPCPTCPQRAAQPDASGRCSLVSKDSVNLLLFLICAVALTVASLPVVGYGPEVMADNRTCVSWLVDTPDTAKRRTYFVAFLAFGFLNLFTVFLAVTSTLLTLNRLAKWARSEGHFRYTEDPSPPLVEPESLHKMYKMIGLILVNQVLWLPALVLVTIQKAGYPISDATLMYTVLSVSLPGLLNPLLLGLLFRDFRQGYRHVIRRVCFCFCCSRDDGNEQSMKDLQHRSRNAQASAEDAENVSNCSLDSSEVNPAKAGLYSCLDKPQARAHGEDQSAVCKTCAAYVLADGLPDERTPLQSASSVPCRPIVASLYDEFGEISHEPKTELLSPCGSEDCLLTSDLFREQSESVV